MATLAGMALVIVVHASISAQAGIAGFAAYAEAIAHGAGAA